jgi:hypothetical protein
MIISGGENIASPEVERVLYEHPAVLEASVIGRPDPRWGEVPVAFVVLREGARAGAEELQEFCRERLARFKTPRAVHFIDALPRNPSLCRASCASRPSRPATSVRADPRGTGGTMLERHERVRAGRAGRGHEHADPRDRGREASGTVGLMRESTTHS